LRLKGAKLSQNWQKGVFQYWASQQFRGPFSSFNLQQGTGRILQVVLHGKVEKFLGLGMVMVGHE